MSLDEKGSCHLPISPPSLLFSSTNICSKSALNTTTLLSILPFANVAATIGTITEDFPRPIFNCMIEFDPDCGAIISRAIVTVALESAFLSREIFRDI